MGSQTPSRASTTTWCHTVAEIGREDFPELGVRHARNRQNGRDGRCALPVPHGAAPGAPSVSLQTEARCGSSSYAARRERINLWPAFSSFKTHRISPFLKQLTCDSYPMLAH